MLAQSACDEVLRGYFSGESCIAVSVPGACMSPDAITIVMHSFESSIIVLN